MKQLHFKNTYSKDSFFNVEAIEGETPSPEPRKFEPHSHDYYVIILTEEGYGKHFIDFNSYDILPESVFFISPNQVHQIMESTLNRGYVISFNDDFLVKSNISSDFFQNINLFRDFGDTPPLLPPESSFLKLKKLCGEMVTCFSDVSPFKYEALGSLLRLFMIECNSVCGLFTNDTSGIHDNAMITIRSFKELVEKNFAKWHKVSDYSEKLSITSDYLNKLSKNYLRITAKDFIRNRIILEAKRMLLDPALSAKEIAYNLGYNEPAHLSNAFKACTGLSLSNFRTGLKN